MKKFRLIIDAECGSTFQADFISKILDLIPQSVKMLAESRHSKNKVTYKLTELKK